MNRYTFMEMDGALAERLNEILLELPKKAPYMMRAYAFDQNRACYLQGVRDFRGLMLGTVPTLEEGDDSDGE